MGHPHALLFGGPSLVLWSLDPLTGPVGGLTDVRASVAGYYDSSGVYKQEATNTLRIRNYLKGSPYITLEHASTNSFAAPEDMTSASWTKTHIASVTANNVTAPDNNVTGDSIVPDNVGGATEFSQVIATTANNSYGISGHFKSLNALGQWVYLWTTDKAGAIHRTWFDMVNGVLGNVDASHKADFMQVANGYYVVWVRHNSIGAGASATSEGFGLSDTNGGTAFTGGDGATAMFSAWGVQFEIRSTTMYMGSGGTRSAETVYAQWGYTTASPFTLYTNGLTHWSEQDANAQFNPSLGVSAVVNPTVKWLSPNAAELGRFHNGAAQQDAAPGVAHNPFVQAEYRLYFDALATAHITAGISINGGAETVAGPTAGQALPGAWGETRLHLACGTGNPAAHFSKMRAYVGNQSLAQCRTNP